MGRGPLAGPVTVCALAVKVDESQGLALKGSKGEALGFGSKLGVRDSKLLSAEQREAKLREFKKLRAGGVLDWRIVSVSHKIIDKQGIVYAVCLAISRALARLRTSLRCPTPKLRVLLDGGLRAPKEYKNQKTIIRGDSRVPTIAAASIIAKVYRDHKMMRLAIRYPNWGFEKHKGYGTRAHYAALAKHGLSPIHRLSFL